MGFTLSGERNLDYVYRLAIPDNIDEFDENQEITLVFKAINDFKFTSPNSLDPWECNFWVQVAVNVSSRTPDDDLLEFYRLLLANANRLFGVEDLSDIDRKFWNLFSILYLTWTAVWPPPRRLLMQCGHLSTAVYSREVGITKASPKDLIDYCSACAVWTDDAEKLMQVDQIADEINVLRTEVLSTYPNKYSGNCNTCGIFVNVAQGTITRVSSKWNLSCRSCSA